MSILRLADFLPYRLSVLANHLSLAIAEFYKDRFDLTTPEWRIIAVLTEFGNLTASHVAQRTAMDKVTVSRAVKRLLKAGRINKEKDLTDKRKSFLSLTEDGKNIYASVAPKAKDYEMRLLNRLSENQKESLDRLLDILDQIQDEVSDSSSSSTGRSEG